MKIYSVIPHRITIFWFVLYNISVLMEDKITISCLNILCSVHILEYTDQEKYPEKIPYSCVFSRVLITILIHDVYTSVSFRNL